MISILAILSFLLGSLPFGLWVSQVFKGIDPRLHGSKNTGATNVGRVIGWRYGFIVLVLDALKGVASCLLSQFVQPSEWSTYLPLSFGVISILGHMYSPFLNWNGGKGVATALGVFLYLTPIPMLICILVFLIAYKLSGFVSVGSILGSISLPISYFLIYKYQLFPELHIHYQPFLFYATLAIAFLITFRHRDNIIRLVLGVEYPPIKK